MEDINRFKWLIYISAVWILSIGLQGDSLADADPPVQSDIHFSVYFPGAPFLSEINVLAHVVADFDKDGDPDIFFYENDWPVSPHIALAWIENSNADGSNWIRHDIEIAPPLSDIDALTQFFATDVDGDGDPDVLAMFANTIVWWENELSDAPWARHPVAGPNLDFAPIALGDLDGDGDVDIAGGQTGGVFLDGYVFWLENATGDGLNWNEHAISVVWPDGTPEPLQGITGEIEITDINGDDDLDLIVPTSDFWSSPSHERAIILENDLSASSSWIFYSGPLFYHRDLIAADLDGNGFMDIVTGGDNLTWRPWWLDDHYWLYCYPSGNPDDCFRSPNFEYYLYPLLPLGVFWQIDNLLLHDVDRDEDPDIAFTDDDKLYWAENRDTQLSWNASDWLAHEIPVDLGFDVYSIEDFSFDDIDLDGQEDLVASIWAPQELTYQSKNPKQHLTSSAPDSSSFTGAGLLWIRNRGGQFALQASSPGDLFVPVCEAGQHPLLGLDAHHRGRPGDHSIQLLNFAFRFEKSDGSVLTSDELESLLGSLKLYSGNPQDGHLLTTITDLTLVEGVLTVELPLNHPAATLDAPQTNDSASSKSYFGEIVTRHAPETLSLHDFVLSFESDLGSAATDAANGAPLTIEYAPDSRISVEIEIDKAPIVAGGSGIIETEVGATIDPSVLGDVLVADECGGLVYSISGAPDVLSCQDLIEPWVTGPGYVEMPMTMFATDVAGNSAQGTFLLWVPKDPCDTDGDDSPDLVDNCAGVDNPDQTDTDGDGLGDACDADDDNDGQSDEAELACGGNPSDPSVLAPDLDGDGNPDCLDLDDDDDLVADDLDFCPGTTLPDAGLTGIGALGKNRWSLLTNTDGNFVQAPPQAGSKFSFTLEDTRGCSCEQIAQAGSLGAAHLTRGCSTSSMLDWVHQFQGVQ
jgi:hypothetical protein